MALHVAVFLDGKCGGALQFGPPMVKRKVLPLVRDTSWNAMLELKRMALADWVPRNGESRVLGICLRMIRRTYPHVDWILSYADATQCGDGTIYRASGFILTGITTNKSIIRLPNGEIACSITYGKRKHCLKNKGRTAPPLGSEYLEGFLLRYIYFLNPEARSRLTVPVLPFSEIEKRGASMFRGIKRGGSIDVDALGFQRGEGGSNPTSPHQSRKKKVKK